MNPSLYRRDGEGEDIHYTVADSSLGRMLVGRTERGICALSWGEDEEIVDALRERFPGANLVRDDAALGPLVQVIEDHLNGMRALPDEPIDARGSDFQQRVWEALKAIPISETRTYTEIAAAIGQPKAARAVARACAMNPVALFIPCHRVVRSNGELAGYRWGLERKKVLLEREL